MEIARPNPAWLRRQAAARNYQPKKIRLLLLGESPPDEERYFYFEGESTADPLFEQVCEVFLEAAPAGEKAPWLKELRRRGVFVADLKPDAPRGKEPLEPYVAPLLINLTTMSPDAIVPIGSEVYEATHSALAKAGFPVVDVKVPAPVEGQEKDFRQKLRLAIVRANLEKLIRPLPAAKKKPAAE